MENYCVYKHTNKLNGKIYIGITCQKPEHRWGNGRGYNGQRFGFAILKYGWDGFEHEVLYSGLSELQAKILEVSLIHYYKSADRKYGYNVSEGGDIISDKTRKKIGKAQKGAKNHMYGKHHSDEARKRISEAQKGANHPKSKSVICTTTGFAFGSTREAGRYYNVANNNICSCCRGKLKSAGKLNGEPLRWKYIRDLKKPKLSESDKEHLRDIRAKFYKIKKGA